MASAELSRRIEKVVSSPPLSEMEDGTECDRIADSVHHIVELEDGGAPRDPPQPDERLPVAPQRDPCTATRGKVA